MFDVRRVAGRLVCGVSRGTHGTVPSPETQRARAGARPDRSHRALSDPFGSRVVHRAHEESHRVGGRRASNIHVRVAGEGAARVAPRDYVTSSLRRDVDDTPTRRAVHRCVGRKGEADLRRVFSTWHGVDIYVPTSATMLYWGGECLDDIRSYLGHRSAPDPSPRRGPAHGIASRSSVRKEANADRDPGRDGVDIGRKLFVRRRARSCGVGHVRRS